MISHRWKRGGAHMAALLSMLLTLALPTTAGAQVAFVALSIIPAVPNEVTVGQQDVAGQIIIVNQSTGAGPVTLTQIGYDPACRTVSQPCGAPDLGVFVVDANAIGTGGACAGVPFLVATANLNFTPGKTVPNLVVVRLGNGGSVDMFNSAGSTHVVYDVAGYFADVPTGADGRYQPLEPARILDTRDGTGGSSVRLGPGASLDLQVTGGGGVPAAGAGAVVMNVAVTNTAATSYLTAHPTGVPRPLAANLNWTAGDTVSNRVIATLGSNGRVTLYNNAGETDLVVDTNGWFTDASQTGTGGVYTPLNPGRILDTRDGTGGVTTRPAGSAVDVQVTGRGGIPAGGVSAVILNATVVTPSGPGHFTIFPAGTARPLASDLNYATGEIRPNLVAVEVGTEGRVSLFTSAGADVVVDVAGYFT